MIPIISIILIVIGLLVKFSLKKYTKEKAFGEILIVVGLLGLSFLSLGIVVDEEKIKINNFEIAKTSNQIFICTDYGVKISEKAKYYNAKKENLEVYHIKKYNSYGIQRLEELEIKLKNKREK